MAVTVTRTSPLVAPTGATASTGTDTGDLTNGKTYYYRIAALTATNSGLMGVPCAEISATADANGSIDLSWNAVVDASAYYVWRTPTSGDYSLNYNDNNNLAKDTHCMLLNHNLTAAVKYTTLSNSLTDLGTTTERSSSHSYYKWFHNAQLYENGRGRIVLTTDSSSVGNFEDIYNDAVSNSYTSFFNKIYDNNGYRIYESIDDVTINGDFEDYSFKFIYHNQFLINNSSYSTTFGKYIYVSNTASYLVCGHWEIVNYNPVGRKMTSALTLTNCNLYGGRCYRDYGIARVEAFNNNSSVFETGGGACSFNNVTMKECTIAGYWQQINLSGSVNFDNIIIERNHRGFSINSDQSSSVFNNIVLNNYQFDTTGNYETTLKNTTFYNGSGVNIHRFYSISDLNRILLDCIFPNGVGLPDGASQSFGTGNMLTLKWSFNLKVLDIDGNVISGANVLIEDAKSNTTSLTTDVNGVITEQELIQAVYYRSTNDDGKFDTTDSYNSYNLTISKSGYKTYKSIFDLTEKFDQVITLCKTNNIVDDEGGFYLANDTDAGLIKDDGNFLIELG